MPGLIGKKVGMTSIFDENGKNVACTVIEAGPCVVTQVKSSEQDGYSAIQMAFEEKKVKHTTKAMEGHFKKAGSKPLRVVRELKGFVKDWKLGDKITVEYFKNDFFVDVSGTTKGKGFQGVVKRHGFAGVNDATHGQHNRNRAPGSLGASSYPSRVFKGMRMAGRDGGSRIKVLNLKIEKIISEHNIMILRGAVPGPSGSYVVVESPERI